MSRQRNRNSLLTSQSRPSQSNNLRDELLSMKYEMKKPEVPLYPLNDFDNGLKNSTDGDRMENSIYPDYLPWKDQKKVVKEETDGLENSSYLNKGYFESPVVSNEYYSVRNIVQATIFSSVDNCNGVLRELSLHLTNAYKARNEVINKIKYESNNFRIPPRVTLTSSKKEAWLKDLANPNIPLLKIGEKLPHGIRNKVLIDSISNRNVPINRALWFTKCVLYGEIFVLKKKHQSRAQISNSNSQNYLGFEKVELQWFQEWTQQVVDYLYKFSKEMNLINSNDRKLSYMTKLQYLLKFVESLYIECLLDGNYFLSLVLKLFKEGLPLENHEISHIILIAKSDEDDSSLELALSHLEYNYGQRLVALTLIKVFWNDILKYDYLCKELSELLLLNYFFIQKLSLLKNSSDSLPESIKSSLLLQIAANVNYLFKCNPNVFIIPNYFSLISETLYEILLTRNTNFETGEKEEILNQLELIKYRNESLMLNLKQPIPLNELNSNSQMETDFITITRSSDDILKCVHQLDNLKLNDDIAEFLKPSTNSNEVNWRVHLHLVLIWCITSLSNKHTTEGILIVCNFIKKRVVQKLSNREGNILKIEFENEILEILYNVAENYNSKIIDYNLYVLINELYQLKILTISAYLRKLIASGIFHITNENEMLEYNSPVKIHLSILQNLPVINNKQCNNILQRWVPNCPSFKEKLDSGKEILKREFLDKILHNSFDSNFENKTSSIRNLDVGIKFLLVNWLTNELKSMISASPKLIHINPEIISNIYHLYSWCDNLTVFFKDVVKYLLKNDGGIIIIYLDSLYLICRLIMQHFRLIKFLAGSVSEVATGYELFNLMILNYRDLVTREFDCFKFKQVWDFIDGSVEKSQSHRTREALRMTSIFEKETAESPMKINTHDVHISTRSSERLPLVEFHQNLATLINYSIPLLEDSEIKELQAKLKISLTNLNPEKAMLVLLQSIVEAKTEDDELFAIKLLVNLQLCLQNLLGLLLQTIRLFIKKFTSENIKTEKFVLFLRNIALYELIPLVDLIESLEAEVDEKQLLSEYVNSLIFDAADKVELMSSGKILMLKIVRESFKRNHMGKFSELVRDNLKSPLSEFPENYSEEITKVLEHIITSNTRLVYGGLFSNLCPQDVIHMVHDFLQIPESKRVNHIEDFKKIAGYIDEINITMFQLLLRALTIKDLTGLNDEQQREKLESMVMNCLEHFKFEFSETNSFFGELFACLLWEHRVHILEILESLFLKSTKIESTQEPYSIMLNLSSNKINLLSIFNDFFKKFLASSTSIVGFINPGFFNTLCEFLNQLVELVQKDLSFSCQQFEDNLKNAISIFLRILIIHKLSLTSNVLTQSNELITFLRNLLLLLNCDFLSKKNEKLEILLHDLLLLMKTSVTQEVSLLLENEIGEPSATSPHEISTDMNIDTTASATATTTTATSTTTATATTTNSRNLTSDLTALFNFPEPANLNPLGKYKHDIDCFLSLEEEELNKGGDIHYFNESNLIVVPSKSDPVVISNPFGLLGESNTSGKDSTKLNARPFKMKSYEIFEDCSSSINDGCLNLQLFDAYTTKENPP